MTATDAELSCVGATRQLRALGVKAGGLLLVHTSFRRTRPVEGGALGLIGALRDAPRGTLVMPSWTGDDEEPFDPLTAASAPDLGIVADMFWRLPGGAAQRPSFRLRRGGSDGRADRRRPPAAAASWRRKPDRPGA